MKTKGTILKREISGRYYYYHKYLDNGKQKNEIIQEDEAYQLAFKINFKGQNYDEFIDHKFNLEVSFGKTLALLGAPYRSFKKRFCYLKIQDYLDKPYAGRVLVLYGLRRTGKTTLMFQTINDLSFKDFAAAAYIKCDNKNTIYQLFDDLKYLTANGFKYIFIDEVTLLEDFVALSSTISDIYGLMAKVVLSGTDSLGFEIASHHELYDRNIFIHTTYISFKEFYSVLGIKSIDKYIEYGGTMSMEGIDYNKTILNNGKQINEYVDSSIIHNIIHSLKNVDNGRYFFNLYDLYEKRELENVINRIVEDSNHRFVISIIEQDFKSHDYGSLKQLLSTPKNYERFHNVLDKVDESKLVSDLMNALNIINKEKQTHEVDDSVLKELEDYLYKLDVIDYVNELLIPSYIQRKRIIFTQPGLRYSQAKILLDILFDDPSLKQYDFSLIMAIKEKLLSDVKGKMIEDMTIYETSLVNKDTFKIYFGTSGEYDMVSLDYQKLTSTIYEIKYSNSVDENQYKYLADKDLNTLFEKTYFPIKKRIVLYRGENKNIDNIEYQNIEDYLISQ